MAQPNYDTPADGRLSIPFTDQDEPLTEQAKERVENPDNQWFIIDSTDGSRVKVDEMYLDDGRLVINILFDDWYASLQVPLRPNRDLRGLLHDLNEQFDIASRESGYYLSNDDIDFVDTFTPDGQGRVTLGREYAGQDVRLIGSVVDDE